MRSVKRSVRVAARDVIAGLPPPPSWIEPQLCKLVTQVPAGGAWAHEIKFDGYCMHARIVGKQAILLTRNGLDWTAKYPSIATALAALKCRQAYIDGELCAVRPDGTTTFAGLQGHGQTPAALAYFVFDLLHLDGEDLTKLPLLERKAKLETLLRRARLRGSCEARSRRDRLKGDRRTLPAGQSRRVGKNQGPQPEGIRDRRLDRSGRVAPRARCCCSAATVTTAN